MEPEREYGNVEYKLKLDFMNIKQFEKRKTQMVFRVEEGDGMAFYYLGVMDDGFCMGIDYQTMIRSEHNLIQLADALNYIVLFVEHLPTISVHLYARKYKVIRSSI